MVVVMAPAIDIATGAVNQYPLETLQAPYAGGMEEAYPAPLHPVPLPVPAPGTGPGAKVHEHVQQSYEQGMASPHTPLCAPHSVDTSGSDTSSVATVASGGDKPSIATTHGLAMGMGLGMGMGAGAGAPVVVPRDAWMDALDDLF